MNSQSDLLVNSLLEKLSNSISGHLPLSSRKLLFQSLTAGKSDLTKKMILTELNAICVRQGLSIWCRKFADPIAIIDILNVALSVASGELSEAHAQSLRDDFYVTTVEDEHYEIDEYPAMFVGHAAANTISEAISNATIDTTDDLEDWDMDPESFYPDYLIASAISGGVDENGDIELRRTFWKWYLTDALCQLALERRTKPLNISPADEYAGK